MKKTVKEQYKFIARLIGNAMVKLSRESNTTDNPIGFRFTEEYDKIGETLSLTIYTRKPGHKEIAIQEFRYKILNDKSKHTQFLEVYLMVIDYLLSTSLLTLHAMSEELNTNKELQKTAKII